MYTSDWLNLKGELHMEEWVIWDSPTRIVEVAYCPVVDKLIIAALGILLGWALTYTYFKFFAKLQKGVKK